MNTIILGIIVIGVLLAIFKPYLYVVYYGLLGSDIGARGITGFLETINPNYSLIMRLILAIAATVAVAHYFSNSTNNSFRKWISISILYIISMITMLLFYISGLGALSFFARVLLAICNFGPAALIIWLVYSDRFDHRKMLLVYSILQCGIAFIIIYGSYFGFPLLNVFNAGLYNEGYYYLDENNSMVALPTNFYLAFVGKNEYFVRCGQFHNSNGLGFAAGTLIFLCISYFLSIKKSPFQKGFFLIGGLLAFLLWCNTGTRGPIVGIIVGIVTFMLVKKKSSDTGIIVVASLLFVSLLVFIFATDSLIVKYFIGSASSGSFASRRELNINAWSHFSDFFLSGCGGDMTMLFENDIDPHELPMRIFCLYGIVPALIVTGLTILKPLRCFFHNRSALSLYASGCFWITFFIGFTNNFAENILYWIVLGEFIISISKSNKRVYSNGLEINNRKNNSGTL